MRRKLRALPPGGGPGARFLYGMALAVGCVAIPLGACGDDAPAGPAPRTVDIEVGDFFFRPVMVEARVGDTIRWTQIGMIPHTATSGQPGAPDAGTLFNLSLPDSGAVAEFTPTEPDTIAYFCIPHPFMTGSIIVTR
jgi:plastocyanin